MKTFFLRHLFRPSLIGFFINPFFLARSSMYFHIRRFSSRISGKTLDIGCGSKPYRHLFTEVSQYIGADIEQSGHKHEHSSVDVFYDGKKFPFEDNSFDSLVFFEVLEHVFNPDDFLKEIKRVVKPNGHCLVTIPFIWGEHEQPYDYARYSSFGLNHLFEKNGFETVLHKKYLSDLRLFFLLLNSYTYTVCKRFLPGLSSWIPIVPVSAVNNLIGLISAILPSNKDLYFGNIYILKNKK